VGSNILSPFYLSLTQYFLIPPLAHKEKMARISEILMRYEKDNCAKLIVISIYLLFF
jgi:hypothetical protein